MTIAKLRLRGGHFAKTKEHTIGKYIDLVSHWLIQISKQYFHSHMVVKQTGGEWN